MTTTANNDFRIGQWLVEPGLSTVSCDGTSTRLEPKVMEVLVCLASHAGAPVSKEKLLQTVWPETFVTDDVLTRCISELRKALEDDTKEPQFIQTIPRKGYRLVVEVKPLAPKRRGLRLVLAVVVTSALVAGIWVSRSSKATKSAPVAAVGTSSIAVLPFADLSAGKDQEYFSDGLAEELLNDLAKIPDLRVAARTSAFQFKGRNEDSRKVGEKLNVANILEGSVRREGKRVRITAQLINTSDGFHLWSASYDREVTDILAVQDEIARSVAASLRVVLKGERREPSARGTSAETYDAYLQGKYFLKQETIENWVKAMGYFEQATKLDPSFAPAWAGLADSRVQLAAWGYFTPVEGYSKGREAVERALALDPNEADAYAVRGRIQRHFDWDWDASDASYKQALALEPGNAHIIVSAAWLKATLGRWEEAVALARRAVELDPLTEDSHDALITMLLRAGRFEEARAAHKKLRELNPSLPERLWIDMLQSRSQEALTIVNEGWDHPGLRLFGRALAYHAMGRKREADAALAELIKYDRHAEMSYQIAEVYAFRGEADRAFEWLERAYDQRDPGLPPHLKGDLLLQNIRHDPRYTALLNKMRLPLD